MEPTSPQDPPRRPRPGPSSAGRRRRPAAPLRRFGRTLRLEPPCRWAWLEPALARRAHPLGVWSPEAGNHSAPYSFIRGGRGERDRRIPVTLEPVARRVLERAGCRVVVDGDAPPPAPGRVLRPSPGDRPIDDALIDFVRNHGRGLVRHAEGGTDPAWLVAQLALAFADATFFVLGTGESQVCRMAGRLRAYGVDAGWATASRHLSAPMRVAVVTPFAMALPPLEHAWRQFLIVLDALHAAHRWTSFAARAVERARVYGLLGLGRRFGGLAADHLAEGFGLASLRIVRHGARDRPAEALTVRVEGGPTIGRGDDPIGLKRRGIWAHPVRNRLIAQLARDLAEHGWDPPGPGRRGVRPGPRPGGATLVLVESIEHAAALARLLPGWPVVAGPGPILDGLRRAERRRLERACSSGGGDLADRAIVTWAGMDAMPPCEPATLIRADGLAGPAPALRRGPLTARPAPQPLRIVDFRDRHHPRLRRWSRLRLEAYAERGWPGVGAAAPDAVDRFLAGTWRG